MKSRVLIVEDNRSLGLALASATERAGLEPILVGSLAVARERLSKEAFEGILLDLGLPDGNGLELLEGWRWGEIPLVGVVTAHGEIENAIESRKLGVARFLTKPIAFDELDEFLGEVGAPQRDGQEKAEAATTLVGAAPAMQLVFQKTAHASLSREPLVIRGASGTGRTHLARLIANQARGPVRWIHASPERGLEELGSQLSGADTVVIEELLNLDPEAQGELLRFCHEHDEGGLPRLIVTTGEEGLRAGVDAGELAEELYYRLQVLEIHLPKLKERPGDLSALVFHFLGQLDAGGRLKWSERALEKLQQHDWPGNLRELRNVVSFCISVRGQTGTVRREDLPEYLLGESSQAPIQSSPLAECLDGWIEGLNLDEMSYQEIHGQVEGLLLGELLKRFDGKPSRMARALAMNRSTLRKKLRGLQGGDR
ncbi:sigma-54-dependent transcriptional regulator [Roseibacillus ishigakijimensis]|uniref:Sigma-54-dependent Fis family transcriptional regulator n=1 Tax=Roseibacillus ishigakijimensis TaxID=454146 RepID=A0A934RQ77_9BACT|nr:response regulator [Roseibacillus ishigakijimensis]MBK1833591.1 sigma-54-dependent Fis family transcriptional regulator [Roseibacillus ishigakijimensis]